MILYFSATGNCKYVAQQIALAVNDDAVSILDTAASDASAVTGIISPAYAWGIPSIVENYLKCNKISKKNNYLFFAATYGTSPGQSHYFANKTLKNTSGIEFDAYYSVKMPDTWTPVFNLSDKNKVAAINAAAEPEIKTILAMIRERRRGNYMAHRLPAIARIVYRPYYHHMRQTKKFIVRDTCTGCGLCALKCPIQAIEIRKNRPVWIKDRCVMCLGCLHRCPEFAIQYGSCTQKHGQYRNPHVSV